MKINAKQILTFALVTVFTLQGILPVYGQQMTMPRDGTSLMNQGGPTNGGSSFRSLFEPRNVPGKGNEKSKNLIDKESLSNPSSLVLTYQVHILGEVTFPGTYRVSVSARLSEAIDGAGGVLERGSGREIELRRNGARTQIVDLLSFKQLGNLNDNPYLLDNDVIYIPLKKRAVEIVGPVKRPDIYEIKNEKTVQDMITLAGGFTPGVSKRGGIKIIRFTSGEKKILDVPNTEEARQKFQIEGADVIIIPHVLLEKNKFDYNLAKLPGDNIFYPSYEDRVFVLGAVFQPGPQPFNQYANLRQYLTLAGGTTKMAKIRKIRILTNSGKSVRAKDTTQINPGDTIIVPEHYMPPESWINLTLGLISTVLGITTTVLVLTNR